MSVKKFKFVSPGIFINEIDNSQVPKQGAGIGPVIIGRTLRGPAMRPVQIESFSDFVETFGEPVAGGLGGDVWRDGNRIGPTYAAFAAQAYLRNASPITFVRLLGEESPDAASSAQQAGWTVPSFSAAWNSSTGQPGAYGLFIAGAVPMTDTDCSKAALAAIIYCKDGQVGLEGKAISGTAAASTEDADGGARARGINIWMRSTGPNNEFKLRVVHPSGIHGSNVYEEGDNAESITFNFSKTSRNYIRNVLNTNPTLMRGANDGGSAAAQAYFLGPTFDRFLAEVQGETRGGGAAAITTAAASTSASIASKDGTAGQVAILVPLADANDFNTGMTPAMSPWIISQHNGDHYELQYNSDGLLEGRQGVADFGVEKLFRFASLYAGEWERKNFKISIYDIKAPTDQFNPYGTFSVMIRKAEDTDAAPQIVERFTSCNLNPGSPDFIARKIGDMESRWDEDDKRYVMHGLYPNQSRYIRVVLSNDVETGQADPRLLPFGFYGPPRSSAIFAETNGSGAHQALSVKAPEHGQASKLGRSGVSGEHLDSAAFQAAANSSGAKTVQSITTTGNAAQYKLLDLDGDGLVLESGSVQNNSYLMVGVEGETHDNFESLLCFPKLGMRMSTNDSTLASPKDAFFGIETTEFGSDTVYDKSYQDLAGYQNRAGFTAGVSHDPCAPDFTKEEYQFIFSLDDIRYKVTDTGASNPNTASSPPKNFEWVAGCHATPSTANSNAATGDRVAVTSLKEPVPDSRNSSGWVYNLVDGHCSLTGFVNQTTGVRDPYAVLDKGIDAFTLPLIGGHDGLDITQPSPFQYHTSMSNTALIQSGDTELDHYAVYSMKKAIDTVHDPEVVEMNLLTMPGQSYSPVTAHMISTCENRGDALAIIDIESDYQPPNLDTQDEAARMPNVDLAITKMRLRSLNSSYGCCFFPWVQIMDSNSGRVLWAPPSLAALGTMASSTRRSELWFAPAGFTRGGLTDGAAGIPVSAVRLRLNSKERDKLYEANINPIAQFPAEGIVIFGQKTLQLTPSALDRINVRRLMIYLKKEISRMAKTILFDQNVKTTWTRFISKADPFLASVKGRFGLTEYKIILDETTTTPDLIDRNIMYAKILLKPAKAIEYIAIDFVITDSGASFDD